MEEGFPVAGRRGQGRRGWGGDSGGHIEWLVSDLKGQETLAGMTSADFIS